MANIFRFETWIDRSNKTFMQAIDQHAKDGKSFNLFQLTAQYAFDTLFLVKTGQSPGFMLGLDINSLTTALEEWKVIFIATGSYLRLHAAITRILRNSQQTTFDKHILQYLRFVKNGSNDGTIKQILKNTAMISIESISTRAACAALIVAASDAIITHIGAALFYIYHDLNILKSLRIEIARAKLTDTVTLKEIIQKKKLMLLLYTCIQESICQWRKHTDRSIFGNDLISENVIFGQDDLPSDFHLAILIKLVIQVVTKFDIVISAPAGQYHFSSATSAVVKYRTRSALATPAIQRNEKTAAWGAFAVDAAAEYKKACEEYKAPEGVRTVDYQIKETFRKRATAETVAEEHVESGPKKKIVPPHLRIKR